MMSDQLAIERMGTGRMTVERSSQQAVGFFAVLALLFAASTALTIVWCASMSEMGGMSMPGGWTMSMAWMRMAGQTWPGAAASFLGMWMVMMVAMMLPAFAPMLWRYRQAVGATRPIGSARGVGGAGETRLAALTALVALGYFVVWTLSGAIVYPAGMMLAEIEMQRPAVSNAVPIAAGLVVLIAGVLQFTAWKQRQLACCAAMPRPGMVLRADAVSAWRYGLRVGVHCGLCCAPLMAILLVMGVMDLLAMAVVTAAITAERLAPAGHRIARLTGGIAVVAGVFLIARAIGVGVPW